MQLVTKLEQPVPTYLLLRCHRTVVADLGTADIYYDIARMGKGNRSRQPMLASVLNCTFLTTLLFASSFEVTDDSRSDGAAQAQQCQGSGLKIDRLDLDGLGSPAAIAAKIHNLVEDMPHKVPPEKL